MELLLIHYLMSWYLNFNW